MREFPTDVEYDERGEGPPLLLLPGSFGTGSGWKAVTDRPARSHRIVTTSLLGYGATAERRPRGNATMRQQTEIVDRILERMRRAGTRGRPFVRRPCSACARNRRPIKPASLMLVEADLYAMFSGMTRDYFAEFESGRPNAARHVIDFYGGKGTFAAFPAKVRDYVIRTTPANILDWSSGTPFEPPLSAYHQIAATTLVVRGGDGHPAMMRIAEILAEAIPHGRLETVAGGSHFLPATHPVELARLLEAHVNVGNT
jgi:pimeloyl-ACP methyl ester carboxylesterase